MARKRVFLTTVFLLFCGGLSACGITGGTSRFVLTLDPRKSEQPVAEIRIASAALATEGARFSAVRVFPWGKFTAADLRNLEQSLRDTISAQAPAGFHSTESPLDIHFIIRRYIVSVSNTAGAVLVCVAWAGTTPEGDLIYHEQFFASNAVYIVGTIGLLKDSIHQAIVRRIATKAISLASGPGAADEGPTAFEGTYTSIADAAAQLPKHMVSLGAGGWFSAMPLTLISVLIPTGRLAVRWDDAQLSEDFNWKDYLRELYTGSFDESGNKVP